MANATSGGTFAAARRAGSFAHASGRYSCQEIGSEASALATESETATWQLSCFPSSPQYCRATPTECGPFFGNPVSSRIPAVTGLLAVIAGSTASRTARSRTRSSQGDCPTICSSD